MVVFTRFDQMTYGQFICADFITCVPYMKGTQYISELLPLLSVSSCKSRVISMRLMILYPDDLFYTDNSAIRKTV